MEDEVLEIGPRRRRARSTAGFESAVDVPVGGIDLKDHLSAIEIGLIRKALQEADGTVVGGRAAAAHAPHHLGREAAQVSPERLAVGAPSLFLVMRAPRHEPPAGRCGASDK